MIPYIDLEYTEWILASIATLGVILGAVLEFRRDKETITSMEVRLQVLERRVERLEEQ